MQLESKVITPEKLKDVLITKTAIKTLQSERTVEKVISFQFQDAKTMAFAKGEIEISGFGTFRISKNKLKRKIERLERSIGNLNRDNEELYLYRLGYLTEMLTILKTRLQQYEN